MKNRDWLSKALLLMAVGGNVLATAGCVPQLNDPDYGPLTSTFAVSDYFAPSGFMGDGANPGYLTVDFDEAHCKQPRPAGHQGRCYTFTYYMDPKDSNPWAGVYWVYPTNSWGARPGYAIDSTKFHQVRFSAAVEVPTPNTKGGNPSLFNGLTGGIFANGFYTKKTDAGVVTQMEHDDVIKAGTSVTIGKELGSDWKQINIPLVNQDPATELIGAFAWSMDFPSDSCTCSIPGIKVLSCTSGMDPDGNPIPIGTVNCPTPVTVHIDDIVWDTNPPPATP
jgi:hypothetical protein